MKTLNLAGATIDEITRDIKTGEFVLKSHGDIKGNLHAQTVIIYGNVSGDIHAEEVLVMGGKVTGRIIADTVACVENKEKQEEKKSCDTCKYHKRLDKYRNFYSCNCDPTVKEIKCEKYQKKENPAKQVSSLTLPTKRKIQQENSSIKNISRIPVKLSRY